MHAKLIFIYPAARFCDHLSTFSGTQTVDVEIVTRLRTTLIRYISQHYLAILEASEYSYIYHHDTRVNTEITEEETTEIIEDDTEITEGTSGYGEQHEERGHYGKTYLDEHDCECENEAECGHRGGVRWGVIKTGLIEHTHASEFDIVTSVTQGSINSTFRAWWEIARKAYHKLGKRSTWERVEIERETCIADYSFVHEKHGDEVFFSASFLAPKVQLICREGSQSVIVYFNIQSGFLKTLGQEKALQPG